MTRRRDVRRINLELGPKSCQALDRLQVALETNSQVETIRLALQTLLRLVDETQPGGRVFVERAGEDRREVILPIIQQKTTMD